MLLYQLVESAMVRFEAACQGSRGVDRSAGFRHQQAKPHQMVFGTVDVGSG
ncbi:hypothetical protein [Nonomuraea recticatena]|uniref:hypothetical protein n=1 Tax=Nonomuraea recticatena TaxID=46178 RepID=UPI0031F7E4C6